MIKQRLIYTLLYARGKFQLSRNFSLQAVGDLAWLQDNYDFQTIAHYGYKFANETPTRVPLSDWYFTTDGKQRGFQARSVVGGIFIKMLADGSTWNKWASGSKRF